ncbi:MAG: hypothetical protein AB7R69_06315 [Candidatus Babeliales bacterium]
MNALKPTLVELKQQIGAIEGVLNRPKTNFSLYAEGIPKNCIVEIAGVNKTEFITKFLEEHPKLQTVWIEREISINPYALWQRGVNLDSILFIECKDEPIWSIQQVLKSQVFEAVILSDIQFIDSELRKFQLLVEKSCSHLFILTNKLHKSWVPTIQIQANL